MKFFSILLLADQVIAHNSAIKEILALCLRFVERNNYIREEFIQFLEVQRRPSG